MTTPIAAILFDLGGVLVDFRGFETFLGWLGPGADEETFWARWLASPTVKAFELGRLPARVFLDGLIEEMDLPVSPDALGDWFERWPRGLAPGGAALLEELRPGLIRACLSNSNPIHWAAFERQGLLRRFDRALASHLLGAIKPEPAAFEGALAALGCPASSVLFLDDNPANVAGARACGIPAERCRGVDEARARLEERRLLRT